MVRKDRNNSIEAENDDAIEASVVPSQELVEFETWYSQREAQIPSHHHKEILKADFRGRKVPALATMAQFDDALRKYGVKLD